MQIPSININWSKYETESDFYSDVLKQCNSPEWHGKNLDALADGWVTGGIGEIGPPYQFNNTNCKFVNSLLKEFSLHVIAIMHDSVNENGGKILID